MLDLSAWERYIAAFDACADHVYRLAVLLAGNRHDAEYLTHELFIAAHPPWRDGRIPDLPQHLRRHLVDRIVTDEHRRRSVGHQVWRRRPHGSAAHADWPSDPSGVLAALDRLAAVPRAALVLRYYEGLSIAEIASTLGLGEPAVESAVQEALRLVRPALEVVH